MNSSTTGRCTDSPGMWGGLVSECQSAQLINSWDADGSSFYGYDSQSSTRLLTNASGAVTDNYAYRAFGPEWQSGNGSRNSYRYEGQYGYYRDSAAMQYVRARYLDVQVGRWASAKAINSQRGQNWYPYGQNHPQLKARLLDASDIPICTYPCIPCAACLIDAFLVCSYCKKDLKCWAQCLLGVWKYLPKWTKFVCGLACGACIACLSGDLCALTAVPLMQNNDPTCLSKWMRCKAACSKCAGPLCCGGLYGVCCHIWCANRYDFCTGSSSNCNPIDFIDQCEGESIVDRAANGAYCDDKLQHLW